ncbi:hypothetical protein [Bradyrhizobium genosp. P]|uniref:hypothetical protein n=1 Tax=Bradyrhizobium genosp. P TaxID=83641 RepID=UPI003CE6CB97
MQMRGRIFDVQVLVLSGAAFGTEYAAAVDLLEIPVRKLVVSLGILRTLVIDSEIPFAVLGKIAAAEEFIFLVGRRSVLAPRIPFVEYKITFADERLGMVECPSV